MKRIQEFELQTHCKKIETALARFQKKFPECYEIWGELIQYMLENGEETCGKPEEAGWHINAEFDNEFGFCYLDVQIYAECQRI